MRDVANTRSARARAQLHESARNAYARGCSVLEWEALISEYEPDAVVALGPLCRQQLDAIEAQVWPMIRT